ncbi:MAG: hypothetical protein ACFFCI_04450 [Promethearchaeota archaeon]
MPYCINCGAKIKWRVSSQKLCGKCEMFAKLLGSYNFIIKKSYEIKKRRDNLKNFIKNILLTFLFGIVILFTGLFISYTILHLLPIDPITVSCQALGLHGLCCFKGCSLYDAIAHSLGFEYNHFFGVYYLPFYRFFEDLFMLNYGKSIIYASGKPVNIMLNETIPYTSVISLPPVIIGFILGIIIGKYSAKKRGKGKGKPLQVFFIFGILLPILIVLMPMLVFTTAFITWQTRFYIVNRLYEKPIFTNTLFIGRIFWSLFFFYVLEDIGFYGVVFPYKTGGFGALLGKSIYFSDYWLLSGCLFVVIIMFVIITITSNLFLSYYKWTYIISDSSKFPSIPLTELSKKV